MIEEIKEILDRLYGFLYKVQNDFGFEYFTKREIELVFDYIKNLQQENERLKEELKNRPIVDFTFDVYKELEDYKSRCKKADEYIDKQKKKMYKSRNKIALFILMKLEKILNGSDEK